MSLIQGVFFGIGMLILAYLLAKNADGYVALLGSSGNVLLNETKALQGR